MSPEELHQFQQAQQQQAEEQAQARQLEETMAQLGLEAKQIENANGDADAKLKKAQAEKMEAETRKLNAEASRPPETPEYEDPRLLLAEVRTAIENANKAASDALAAQAKAETAWAEARQAQVDPLERRLMEGLVDRYTAPAPATEQ
jgi:hypothetical protein